MAGEVARVRDGEAIGDPGPELFWRGGRRMAPTTSNRWPGLRASWRANPWTRSAPLPSMAKRWMNGHGAPRAGRPASGVDPGDRVGCALRTPCSSDPFNSSDLRSPTSVHRHRARARQPSCAAALRGELDGPRSERHAGTPRRGLAGGTGSSDSASAHEHRASDIAGPGAQGCTRAGRTSAAGTSLATAGSCTRCNRDSNEPAPPPRKVGSRRKAGCVPVRSARGPSRASSTSDFASAQANQQQTRAEDTTGDQSRRTTRRVPLQGPWRP